MGTDRTAAFWIDDGRHGREELVLCCPVCGYDHSHHETEGDPWSDGESLFVPIRGECGHVWRLEFYQHKGHTFVRAQTQAEGGQR